VTPSFLGFSIEAPLSTRDCRISISPRAAAHSAGVHPTFRAYQRRLSYLIVVKVYYVLVIGKRLEHLEDFEICIKCNVMKECHFLESDLRELLRVHVREYGHHLLVLFGLICFEDFLRSHEPLKD
jgi:hypothetical protein